MVQTISLLDTQDITPQKTKNIKISSNSDFLELLMKDIANNQIDDEKTLSKDTSKDIKDNNKKEKNLLADLLNNTNNLKDLDENQDLKTLIDNNPKINEDIVKEVKNIISSKIKQDNILMSKSDIKEFKQIDNIKDLLKFADKKGLNLQSIKFEIPDKTKNSIKESFVNHKNTKNNQKQTTHINTQNILEKKQNHSDIKINTNHNNSNPKHNIKHKTSENNVKNSKISLETILNKSTKEVKNSSNTKSIKNEKIDIKPQTTTIQDIQPKISKDSKKIEKEIKIEPDTKKTIKTKEIDLSDLITPKSDKKVVKIKQETQSEINLNQSAINEIKAKSVQAKQTIESFKNNLDEAIKNYKPPISKVDIELNPKNLGKVEVSIVQRGNNIQVHMNTDQSNVALFQQHQAEFRQALANIGFSNIDMNFNSNQDRDRRQNQAKKTYKENESIEDIADIEINASYQYA